MGGRGGPGLTDLERVKDIYRRQLDLPWQSSLSPAERVWMLVHDPALERAVRYLMQELELITGRSGRQWQVIDVTDEPGRWLAEHPYADALFADPSNLTDGLLEELEERVVGGLREEVSDVGRPDSIIALVGMGSLYPFVRVSRVLQGIEDTVPGRLLVPFPGRYDALRSNFRLFDTHDGFNYRAVPLVTEVP